MGRSCPIGRCRVDIMTYEFTTHNGRKGEVTLDEFGGIASGVFIFGDEVRTIEFLDRDRVFGINHPSFLTISPKE